MKSIISFFLVSYSTIAICQNLSEVAVNKNVVVGKVLATNSALTATQFVFNERIHDFHVDKKNSTFNVQLRGKRKDEYLVSKGNILQYDFQHSSSLWIKEIFYGPYLDIIYFDTDVFLFNGVKSNLLNNNTGEVQYAIKKIVNLINYKLGIAIAYRNGSNTYKNTLYGINVENGEELWEREINKDYNWNSYEYLNDTTLLIASSGLHTLNLKTGEGWSYQTETGRNDFIGKPGTSVAGRYFNTLEGVFFNSSKFVVGEVASNVVKDQNAYYLASINELAKIDKYSGKTIWTIPYSRKSASKSNIYLYDNLLLVVNMGHASLVGKSSEYGNTYIGAFDTHSGAQVYINFINSTDKVILGSTFINKELILLFEDSIAKYNPSNGQLLATSSVNIASNKVYANNFADNNIFTLMDANKYVQLNTIDTLDFCIRTHEKVIIYANDLSVKQTLPFTDLAVKFYDNKYYKLLCNNTQIMVTDTLGQVLANFDLPFKTDLINNQIYNTSDGRHYIFDTASLLWFRNSLIYFKVEDDTFYLSSGNSIFTVDLSPFSIKKTKD